MKTKIFVLAALAIAAYLPILTLPFISDDFTQIPMARHYVTSWNLLVQSHELRTRLTYVLLDGGLDHLFGFSPRPFYVASIMLHFLCTLLVFASGSIPTIGLRNSFWAACFFAVCEGHQEAVMWIAASMELFVFLFGVGAVLLWCRWLKTGSLKCYALAMLSFALAALSKESVWIFPVLMALVGLVERVPWRRALKGLAPFCAATAGYVLWLLGSRSANGRFNDGSFSLEAPWLRNDLNSAWHVLLIWGILALIVIAWKRDAIAVRVAWLSCLWMVLSILPYSFLTYMPRVPSRHTYLASMGLAWLVASAFELLRTQFPRASWIAAAIVLLVNCELLWVKKLSQFRERAEPTELLQSSARQASGDIHIRCIPVNPLVAQAALREERHAAVFDQPQAGSDAHCFDIWYTDRAGNRVEVKKQLATERHGWLW